MWIYFSTVNTDLYKFYSKIYFILSFLIMLTVTSSKQTQIRLKRHSSRKLLQVYALSHRLHHIPLLFQLLSLLASCQLTPTCINSIISFSVSKIPSPLLRSSWLAGRTGQQSVRSSHLHAARGNVPTYSALPYFNYYTLHQASGPLVATGACRRNCKLQ